MTLRTGADLPADWNEWTQAEFDEYLSYWNPAPKEDRAFFASVERPGVSLADERAALYARYGVER